MSYRLIFGYFVLAVIALVLLVAVVVAVKVISLDTPEAATPPNAKVPSYVVEKGDSLSGISSKTGVSVERIEELNPKLDPLALAPGKRIELKPKSARDRRRARRQPPRPRLYVVRPGDGLFSIGEKTHVDQESLRSLNPQLDLDMLTPGMRLKLRR